MVVLVSMVLLPFVLGCVIPIAMGAPIPIMIEKDCGMPNTDLSVERQKFCCTHFKLNCPELLEGVDIQSRSKPLVARDSDFTKQGVGSHEPSAGVLKLLKVRKLGQRCDSLWVRCATGLQCRYGFCLRERTAAHLRHLIDVGKQVEAEERATEEDDVEDGDPLPAKEDMIVKGQSINLEESYKTPVSAEMGMGITKQVTTINIGIHSTSRPHSRSKTSSFPKSTELPDPVKVIQIDKAVAYGNEEDEMAANIADYLSLKGKKLSRREQQTVRDLIAGTLDERVQRDEQVEQVEAAELGAILNEDKESQLDERAKNSMLPMWHTPSQQPRCNAQSS